ncbi:MAG TPA: hypothetical protein VJG32_17940 [Anaerolineae bacterium]|nr:hypothetical protein [Anaerolineae bacterium]
MEQLDRQPKVGDQVRYYAYGTPGGEYPAGAPRLAWITEVDPPNPFDEVSSSAPVGICVVNPTGLFFNQHIPYGPGLTGHWGWPDDEGRA